jgi:crotonobetainyl-CoA:carnitine CoA-transferase CaiB-like acyl-CoA transferase
MGMENSQREHVLSGYKVMDFTQYLAGPAATRLMVDMGAEVIKVELAPNGDNTRGIAYVRNGRSGYFVQQNLGKKSLCIDARGTAGKNILKELIAKMDVLIENFAPGVIGRMGLSYETVKSINPRLVMCSISAFGQSGPLAALPGFDYIGAAYAGILDLLGTPGEPPIMPGLSLGDNLTGLCALNAILGALLYRGRSGKGQYIDVSLLDSYFQSHDLAVQFASASHGQTLRQRVGRQDPNLVPVGIFKSSKHYVTVLVPADHLWKTLCDAIGKPGLADDARFARNEDRAKNRHLVYTLIQEWFDSVSEEEALRRLQECRVPAAPILSVPEAMKHPHLVERGTIRPVNDRILGELELPGSPLRFSDFPHRNDLEAPLLGEHNLEILREHLGYSPEQVSGLEADGVLLQKAV